MPGTTLEGEKAACSISCEIVVRIAVELQDADLDQRIVGVRPDLGQIERVVPVLADVGLGHDLHVHASTCGKSPRSIASNRSPGRTSRVRPTMPRRLAVGPVLDALLRLEVELHPVALAGCVDERDRCASRSRACSASDCGMPRSDNRIVTWCRLSGDSDQKSHIAVGERMLVFGWRFCVWMKSGNL